MPAEASQRNEPTADSLRGIRNAEARYQVHAQGRLTSSRLRRKGSLKKDSFEDEATNNLFNGATNDPYFNVPSQTMSGQKILGGNVLPFKSTLSTARRLSRFSVWMGVWIAVFSYMIQLLFAFVSLVAFALHGVFQTSWFAKSVDFVFSFFTNVTGANLSMDVGLALWGCATAIVVITFLGFLLWYKFVGVDPFHSVLSTLITVSLLAVSLLPVGNLFPGILIWVVYMNITSLTSLFSRR